MIAFDECVPSFCERSPSAIVNIWVMTSIVTIIIQRHDVSFPEYGFSSLGLEGAYHLSSWILQF